MYGDLADIYQSSEHGARPTRNLRPPSGDHPHARVLGLGAERAAAHGYIIPDDSGSEPEEGLAAGGPAPEPPMSGRGALTHWDGGGTTIHAMNIEGARRRSHEPTAVRPER
jgi:hypothetical protein